MVVVWNGMLWNILLISCFAVVQHNIRLKKLEETTKNSPKRLELTHAVVFLLVCFWQVVN